MKSDFNYKAAFEQIQLTAKALHEQCQGLREALARSEENAVRQWALIGMLEDSNQALQAEVRELEQELKTQNV